jgi:hypothetical protein
MAAMKACQLPPPHRLLWSPLPHPVPIKGRGPQPSSTTPIPASLFSPSSRNLPIKLHLCHCLAAITDHHSISGEGTPNTAASSSPSPATAGERQRAVAAVLRWSSVHTVVWSTMDRAPRRGPWPMDLINGFSNSKTILGFHYSWENCK